ncbi:DUF6314 family protein [uncultured Ruegeria sp.]|uniref:DUF6314 family protein n=1 Tax=uncultured Ruegeria sp. TaxID=259304 RepID=UPI00263674E8|nr:DUF6314 family protein [uncultured Ruegeria sp.]
MTLPKNIDDFQGVWSLTRVIRDARASQVIHADGKAELQHDARGLIYDETVTLRIPGQPAMTGTRRYFWRDAGDQIAIHFDDDRYFHGLRLGQTRSEDHHDCPPDSYDAHYDFSGWPRWTVRWTVSGPRKSYDMETKYALR